MHLWGYISYGLLKQAWIHLFKRIEVTFICLPSYPEALVSFYYWILLRVAFYVPKIKDIGGQKFCSLMEKEIIILVSVIKFEKLFSNTLQPKKRKKRKTPTTCQSVKITNSRYCHAVLIIVSNLQAQQWNTFRIMKYLFLSITLASWAPFIMFANSSSNISLTWAKCNFQLLKLILFRSC